MECSFSHAMSSNGSQSKHGPGCFLENKLNMLCNFECWAENDTKH